MEGEEVGVRSWSWRAEVKILNNLGLDTENTETPPSPESRLRAIDGGEMSPDYKPYGLNRRRLTLSPYGSSGLEGITEIRPTGERHGKGKLEQGVEGRRSWRWRGVRS